MRPINNFEDLQCWKDSVALCDTIYELCEKAKIPTDDELACRRYVAALHVSGKIAFAYGPEDVEWFLRWMPLPKKYCMETVFWTGIALKKGLITQDDYNAVVEQTNRIISKIDSILRYLKRYGYQEKYRWNVFFKSKIDY